MSSLAKADRDPSQVVPEQADPTAAGVSISHVSKAFRLPHQRYHTLKERVLHPLASKRYSVLPAVDDVSVQIGAGEFFGIVGRNGSGKSTLLKCIAGIYDIDGGELRVSGRLSPFIELGVGFNMDLTARDNVMINAVMLGLTPRQARERFDEIIAFAELEEFLDLKLKNYSSGMSVRLAFSVAIQVDAEILLIDEVLAVGDASFQRKCFEEFERLKRRGRTILFVTHDMGSVERLCDRAMLMERGKVKAIGDPGEIARRYNELNFGRLVHELAPEAADTAAPKVEVVHAWFEDEEGSRIAKVEYGTPCSMCAEMRFIDEVTDPVFGFTLRNEVGSTVFASTTAHDGHATGRFTPGTATVRLRFSNWLTASTYSVSPSVELDGETVDVREDAASLQIVGGVFTGAVVDLPHDFEVVKR